MYNALDERSLSIGSDKRGEERTLSVCLVSVGKKGLIHRLVAAAPKPRPRGGRVIRLNVDLRSDRRRTRRRQGYRNHDFRERRLTGNVGRHDLRCIAGRCCHLLARRVNYAVAHHWTRMLLRTRVIAHLVGRHGDVALHRQLKGKKLNYNFLQDFFTITVLS